MISVSARKSIGWKLPDFIDRVYSYSLDQIDSVFGYSEFCVLYGGRPYHDREITEDDLKWLYNNDKGYRIPLTNHFATYQEFKTEKPFLTKYHKKGNTIICTNDDLAEWVKNEYPDYHVEASAIKKLDKLDRVNKALKLYDSIVLPASENYNLDLLNAIKEKDRVRLFVRAGCAVNCPSRICYLSCSKMIKGQDVEFACSQSLKARQNLGKVNFDIDELKALGYSKFKATP